MGVIHNGDPFVSINPWWSLILLGNREFVWSLNGWMEVVYIEDPFSLYNFEENIC